VEFVETDIQSYVNDWGVILTGGGALKVVGSSKRNLRGTPLRREGGS
jgi:hypothetical protein